MTEPNVEFVLFDLGGVLIELGEISDLQERTGFSGSRDTWQEILEPWICRFETGECSASEFSTGVVAGWGVPITPERYLEILCDCAIGPYPGATELLSEIRQVVEVGCLSNTNALHWEDQAARWPILTTFDAVADHLPCEPDRVLFLDDLAVNTDAARAFGFQSEHVRGLDEVETVLREVGLLNGR